MIISLEMKEMKPLRILLGNNTLSLLAGSETWTETLALQLKKMGHDVHCFSPELGVVSKRLEDAGIPCFNNIATSGVKPFSIILEPKVEHEYDVIIANHNHVVKFLRSQFPKAPIISTIHGIIHEDADGKMAPEHPALDSGVAQFVAVSEEVKALLLEKYNLDSVIVRNFIDTEHFKAKRKIAKAPKQILFNSNYNNTNDQEVKILRDVAKHYGAKLAAIGQNFGHSPDPMKAIETSDIVIGMGRSVLEGLAAGRPSIVFGRWGYGGLIALGSFEQLRSTNFSGRGTNFYEGANIIDTMISEIDSFYSQSHSGWGRNYILRDHNVVHAAEMYVQMARELTGQNFQVADTRRPYKRQRDAKTSS